MKDKNLQNTEGIALNDTNMAAKRNLEITSEMIDNAQTVAEVERYRVEILAYRNKTLKRFRTYEKLSIGQQKFLSHLKCLRIQCHHRIATLSEITSIERDITRNERIISCAFMKYAKEELSEEQYNRIYGKALEKVGKRLQSEADINVNFDNEP